jgi:hypothetical protein
MIDYQEIERVCKKSSAISGLVIDDFLINFMLLLASPPTARVADSLITL